LGSSELLDIAALGVEVTLRGEDGDRSDELQFEVIGTPRGLLTTEHVHLRQVERHEVISGEMLLDLNGEVHRLRPGETMEVPASVPHRQRPAGAQPGHVRVTVRPEGRTREFLERLALLSRERELNRLGLPRPVAGAKLIHDFADEGHATRPPVVVQRAFSATVLALAPLAERLRGIAETRAKHAWREYVFVDEWQVAAPQEAVFAALADDRTYPQWWRPVYIDVEADGPPTVGKVARQHFKGRLPYHLRTRSRTVRLQPPELVEAEVDGDLRGNGVWMLTATDAGTHVRFDWTVHADRRLLRLLTPLLRPLFRWNHNWAIARAMEGLEPYAQQHTDRIDRVADSQL
jgi:mannose-6-phosphate isomerase-like protein (cupin superfamily)/uncharacterized protein YndB with AHSA1/START domain